jgi:hypothetical protein
MTELAAVLMIDGMACSLNAIFKKLSTGPCKEISPGNHEEKWGFHRCID